MMLVLFVVGTSGETLSTLTDIQCSELQMPVEEKSSNEKEESKTKELDDYENNYSYLNSSYLYSSFDYNSDYLVLISFYKEIPSPPPDLV